MIRRFLAWLRALFARLFGRAAPAPGYFAKGSAASLRGIVAVAPFLAPSRDYLVYVPRGYRRGAPRTLLVFIHGCRQTPEAFAEGTRIARLADEHGWLVLLPRQAQKANRYGCWNWFDPPTSAGRGEAAIVVAQVKAVRRSFAVDPRRIVLAGFSSGAALAAILGVRHPAMFAGVFVHSGLPCDAATLPASALDVMRRGADGDPAKAGARARLRTGPLRLPVLVVHGAKDDVVAPINGEQVAAQFRALNGDAGSDVVAYRSIATLAHAWSGGDGAHPYNDPAGPDATAMLGEFVTHATRA